MVTGADTLRRPEWQVERQGDAAVLRLVGDWLAQETGLRTRDEVQHLVGEIGDARHLRFEAGGLGDWDSALVVFVQELDAALDDGVAVDRAGLPEPARRLLALAGETPGDAPEQPRTPPSLPTRTGLWTMALWDGLVAVATLVGETVLAAGAALVGRVRTRGVDVLQQMRQAGAGALLIVLIVNALVGGILAFVGAIQLRRFGAGIYVVDLVGIAMVREMAAVMTAIVMAGRTGGAYAAQIATMQGNEEIDALKALGIPINEYLVLPRVLALVTMMPLLYLYGCVAGLFGGLVVGMATLDLALVTYVNAAQRAIAGSEFVFGSVKSLVFGAMIAWIGCHVGLKAGRSAADVGIAATSAVVAGIIGVIAVDALFAVCAEALGI